MKRIISILLVTVLMVGTCISVSADEIAGNTYNIDDVTVIFGENSQLSNRKQEEIANLLANPEYGVSTAGVMCDWFGHKNTTETVVTITHCYNVESPRCMQEIFAVTTCSRCDESTVERLGYSFITCCPED